MLVEKGSGDTEDVELVRAAPHFRLVATMNPGGDFGKKEVKKGSCWRDRVHLSTFGRQRSGRVTALGAEEAGLQLSMELLLR